MKVFVLTEIDLRHVGYSPNTILLFTTHEEAEKEMERMYKKALKDFDTTEDDCANAMDKSGYAYIADADYRLDINECELDLRNYIHDIQEMTVVAEKNQELDTPYPEIERLPDNVETGEIFIADKDFFGDDDEHEFKITAHDGEATGDGIYITYPKLADLTKEQIDEIEHYTGRIFDSGCITPWDVCLKFGEHRLVGIMDTGNGHNEHLVSQINKKWLKFKKFFKPILIALYTRDIDEITDSDAFKIPKWLEFPEYSTGCDLGVWDAYNKRCLDDMIERWDLFADNYLQHIADDQDLKTILTFVRYDVCEDYS